MLLNFTELQQIETKMADNPSPQDGALQRRLDGGRTKMEKQHGQWTSAITKTRSSPQVTTNGEQGQNKKTWSPKPTKCLSYLSGSGLKRVTNWNLWRDFTFSWAKVACSWLGWPGTAGRLGWLHGAGLFHFPWRGAVAACLLCIPCLSSPGKNARVRQESSCLSDTDLKRAAPFADIMVLFLAARS